MITKNNIFRINELKWTPGDYGGMSVTRANTLVGWYSIYHSHSDTYHIIAQRFFPGCRFDSEQAAKDACWQDFAEKMSEYLNPAPEHELRNVTELLARKANKIAGNTHSVESGFGYGNIAMQGHAALRNYVNYLRNILDNDHEIHYSRYEQYWENEKGFEW